MDLIAYTKHMDYAERIKELRQSKNLSQMQLSKLTGLSQSAIAKWELRKTEPTASAIITLSKFFGETVGYILGVED